VSLTSFELYKVKNKQNLTSSPREKRLQLYNPYPGNYSNFKEMILDLDRIAGMGFKEIWVNPFYDTCKTNPIMPEKTHCPYAMRDHQTLNPEYGTSFDEVVLFTKRATELGLVPLFDFVARHVSIDHPFVKGCPYLLQEGIDTTRWFKRHTNGNLMIKGLDENYIQIEEGPWSDVAEFDYSSPKIRQEIFEYFWKPFIKFNIKTLGFKGARLDAVGYICREAHEILLPYINKYCQKIHGTHAYLVAETVGINEFEKNMVVQGLVTHTINSAYWMPGPEGYGKHHYDLWREDENWYAKEKGRLQQAAPSAGHAGSHDEPRFAEFLQKQGISDPTVAKQRMLEKMMVAAFGSDGGHILSYGDEFGIKDRVNLHKRKAINLNKDKQYDLSEEIKAINDIIAKLPPPSYPEWVQRVFYDTYPELVIFIVHQGEGFSGKSHVIIGNTYNHEDKGITVDSAMLNEIMKANGRNNSHEKQAAPTALYLCGKIRLDSGLDIPCFHDDALSPHQEKRQKKFGAIYH